MRRSVLVVEDEPNIALSLEVLMRQAGFDVRIASGGETALREINDRPPDVVLLDIMIPECNGYDVCETIRANPVWRDVRIVMVTAKGRDRDRDKGLAVGADDYVTKPFSTRDLVERVKQLTASSAR